MAVDLATIGIELATQKLKEGLRELEKLQGVANKTADAADGIGKSSDVAFGKTAAGAKRAAQEVKRLQDQSVSAFDRLKTSANGTASAFDRLQRIAVGGFVGGALAKGLISSIDAYTKFTSQLKLATEGQQEYNTALDKVRAISKAAQSDIGAIGVLYARIARNTAELGITQERVGKITEAVGLALKSNGASAAEASSAMLQLSQAFGSGFLRGEEFNAVNEAAPNLLKAVAEQLRVSQGALKKMAEEGLITSQVLAIALPNALEKFRKEAAQVQTISGAFVNLRNEFTLLLGSSAEASGGIKLISSAVNGLANSLEELVNIALIFGGLAVAAKLGKIAGAAIEATKATLALSAAQAAANGASIAGAGATALATRALGFLGGPIGIAISALGLAATAWNYFSSSSEDATKKVEESATGNTAAVRLNTSEVIEFLDQQIAKYKELEVAANKVTLKDTVADQKSFVAEQIRLLQQENTFNGQTIASTAAKNEILRVLGGQYNQLTIKTNELDVAQKKAFSKEAAQLVEKYNEKFADSAGKADAAIKAARLEFEKLGQALPPELEKKIRDSFVKPSKDAENALKQSAKAREAFIETLRTEQTQLEASIATQGKLSEYDKDRIKAMQIFGEQLPQQVENQLLINKTLREEAELREQIAKDEAKAIADGEKRIDDIIEQAQQIERQNRVYGLGKDAVEELIIAELERKKVGASPEIVAQLEREIEARQRLAGALNQEESFKAAEKAAKEAEREFDRVTDEIGKNLAEALLSGGKDGTKKLGEYMKRYFLQLVIRTQIEPIIKQAAGGILGGGSGQGFSMQGLAGALGSLSTFSTGGAFGTALSQGLESLALNPALLEKIGNGIFFNSSSDILSGLGRDLATSATSISSFAGQIAPYAGSIAAVLQGDIKGGLGSAAGTYIGGAIAGPIGAAIGSYLGGMLGGGGKISATTLPGSVGANIAAQIEAQYMATVKALGGRAADATFAAGGNTGRQGQNPNFTAYASVGGRQVYNSGQSFGGDGLFLRGEIALNEQNVAAQALRATIAALKETNFAANVNAFFDTVNAAGASIEQLGKALETAQLLTFVNKEFRSLGGALATLADASVETIGQFFAVTGGMENLSNGITAFFDAFYTEQEKSARLLNQVTNAFAELGKPLPSTRQELRALVDGLDLRNAADQQIYATILQLTPALNALLPAFDGVGDSVEGLLTQITGTVTTSIDKQIDLSKRAAGQARDASRVYQDLAKSLRAVASSFFVRGNVQAESQQFQSTFTSAIGGDTDALGKIGGQATQYLESFANRASTSTQVAIEAARVRVQIEQAAAVADALGVGADVQERLFNIQTQALEVVKEQLQSGNLTLETLQSHTALLEQIGVRIAASGSLVAGATYGAAGNVQGALFDANGNVVAQLSSDTIVAIQALQNQSAQITRGAQSAADSQSIKFNNTITGQTASLTGLTKEQISELQDIQGIGSQALSVSDLIAQFTGGSEDLLNAVLGRLNAQETGTVDIVSQLQRGNIEIGNYLTQLIAAVKQQSEAAAAELKRKQDLESAQSKLAEIAKNREGAISGVSKSSQDIFGLAAKYGVFLNADQGAPLLQNTAKFGVNSQGLFDAIFNQISTSGGDPAGFKREFYATGGLYSQTYGRSGELGNYLTEIEAQRDLVRSLGGVPQFANGGMFGGGMRIVGERGPELEATGPARYWNAAQTRMMMSSGGGNADLVMEMRATRLEIFRFREESAQYDYAIAKNTMSMDRRFERFDDGDRLRISVDQEAGETVNVTVVA